MLVDTPPQKAKADERVARLNTASQKRVIDPDRDMPGGVGDGQVLPDDLLSVSGLDLELTRDQKARLSREEVASITEAGIRFEAVLEAGFALQVVHAKDLTDPRVTYLLHEMGEETRHQRLFIRMLEQLQPTAKDPLDKPLLRFLLRLGIGRIVRMPALLYTLVLGGEEIPDLIQKLACEHPGTDPFIREVNRYHRQEEARHLAFARVVLPEAWQRANRIDRFAVQRIAPLVIGGMFDTLVHPGVYETVGLPGWSTWKAANRSPKRVAVRHQATRPILKTLIDIGALRTGRIPKPWQRLCGVNRHGDPLPPVLA
jgi:hypothetical protein